MVAPSRVRRAEPWGFLYKPRGTRRLSSVEIDAFNQGLHNKRPKFIGKRRVPFWTPYGPDDEVDDGDGLTLDKRGPRRKFLGKRSDVDAAGNAEDIIRRTIRARKFVGKRGQRKFLGRRSDPHYDDEKALQRLNRQLNNLNTELSSYLDKRAPRKFVG